MLRPGLSGEFAELSPQEAPCRIEKTEERGISLSQLVRVIQFLRRRCDDKGVIECWDDEINIRAANLYNLNQNLIVPSTHAWVCSFVELISVDAKDQMPEFFVSHWWGEPVVHFVMCLQQFSKSRKLQRAVFWVCAYANNQHDLGGDVSSNPADSSFRRAMALSLGSVVVLDGEATPFTRVWCTFEIYTTLQNSEKTLDLVTLAAAGEALPEVQDGELCLKGASVEMITEGFLPEDKDLRGKRVQVGHLSRPATAPDLKGERESRFPLDIAYRGVRVSVEHATASVDADRVHILNSIAGNSDLDATPAENHPNYAAVNGAVRSRFAVAILVQAVRQGSPEHIEECMTAICLDNARTELDLQVPGAQFSDDMLQHLAENLNSRLESLGLGLGGTRVTDEGATALGLALCRLQSLTCFSLYVNNKVITNRFMVSLAGGIFELHRLSSITMYFTDTQVGDAGASAIAEAITCSASAGLRKLQLGFSKTHITDAGVESIALALTRASSLEDLGLTFNFTNVGSTAVNAISRCIPELQSLSGVWLGGFRSKVDDSGAVAIFQALSGLPRLSKIMVNFEESRVRPELCSVRSAHALRRALGVIADAGCTAKAVGDVGGDGGGAERSTLLAGKGNSRCCCVQ